MVKAPLPGESDGATSEDSGALPFDSTGDEAEDAGKPHYVGHRQRLRDRFLAHNGPASLADYELLELLLFPAKPRQDVKPLAKALLARFDGFAGVLAADQAQLLAFPGLGEASVVALKLAQAAAERLLRQEVHNRPVLSTWQKLIDYCTVAMSRSLVEEFRLLFLDRKNVLIADEVHQTGTVDHTPAYPREVVKRALELGASALILVHNHPSGDPTPSKSDIEITREIAKACAALGLQLHDHIVIGRGKHASFKSMGFI